MKDPFVRSFIHSLILTLLEKRIAPPTPSLDQFPYIKHTTRNMGLVAPLAISPLHDALGRLAQADAAKEPVIASTAVVVKAAFLLGPFLEEGGVVSGLERRVDGALGFMSLRDGGSGGALGLAEGPTCDSRSRSGGFGARAA